MTNTLITIGITYYNASKTIAKAINSALCQTWQNTEVIIVNDCSDELETRALDELLKEFPSIRVIHMPENRGVAAARNEVIRCAKGEFLVFFDDDDESAPERTTRQYERITSYEAQYAHGAPVICYTSRLQRYPDGQDVYEKAIGTNTGPAPSGKHMAVRILTGKPQPDVQGSAATCSQMARLSTYKQLNGFDVDFRRSEDTDLNIRAAFAGAHFIGLDEPLVVQTMTLTSDKKVIDEEFYFLKLLSKHKSFIEEQADYLFCREWLSAKFTLLKGHKIRFGLRMIFLLCRHPILTVQRIVWSLPNAYTNLRFMRFHNETGSGNHHRDRLL